MKKAPLFSLLFAGCGLVAATVLIAAPVQQASDPQPAATASDDAGAALLGKMCNDCHDSGRISEKRRTKDEWQSLIVKMIQEGASGEQKDFEAVFEYLCLNHGEVHINSAQATEITMTLGVSRKDADAIVAYRTAHGPFADLSALKKVPEVDGKKIDEHKDALAF